VLRCRGSGGFAGSGSSACRTFGTPEPRNLRNLRMTKLVSVLLLVESLSNALYLAGLIGVLAGYDPIAVTLILARGLTGALQFAGGWTLAIRRPAGKTLARLALLVAAALTTLDVGFNLAPTSVYAWWRLEVVGLYWVYALAGTWYLSRRA